MQLGPEITGDVDNVRALLARFGISDANPPRDSQVVEVVSTLARLALEGGILCDVTTLVRVLSSFVRLICLLFPIVIDDVISSL
jgi:CCR4-NOT transcription complex subunit 1